MTWLLPNIYCISNKMKDIHFKILHKVYPVNSVLSKYLEVENKCSFCDTLNETLINLFFKCKKTKKKSLF